jgi:DNA-binding NarL/FixJ family response regulator
LAGLRVLVVEDQHLLALDIEALLTDAGAEVVGPAANMTDALGLISFNDLDVAVLDLMLPEGPVYPLVDLANGDQSAGGVRNGLRG